MTQRPLRRYGDPVLRMTCAPVTAFDDSLARLVGDLMDTVDQPGRAGLAAPQIGVPLRVFSYLVDDRHGHVVNPEIVALSDAQQDGEEGCLSIPGLWYPLRRAAVATVRGVNAAGDPVEVTGDGLLARCLQHEVDHLDGVVYLDRLGRLRRRRALRDLRDTDWFLHPSGVR
ncbi:MAG TPA: peptide deformylase [Euzebyales bacterium]|nr:peptide deformylase [Euzebyales bacterium]